MRNRGFPLSAILMLALPGLAFAQGWIEYANVEEGFFVNFPGEPTAEQTTWETEFGAAMPARVYSVENSRGSYSVTVVDFRDAQRIHSERVNASDCPPGAETCIGGTGGTGLGYWRVEMQGSMVYGAWQMFQRDAEVTHLLWNFVDLVEGLQVQLINPDQSRTFASLYLHRDRLYILEATASQGRPGIVLFQQSLRFLDEDGGHIRYERFYHNSAPPPPRLQ